jgi:hypothetical protein
MGPPPKEFLERSPDTRKYWDADGVWIADAVIPDQSIESRETRLDGEDKELLLQFVRKILRWLPEERPSAHDILTDDFLLEPIHRAAREAAKSQS